MLHRFLKLLNDQLPEVNGHKAVISVRNETEGLAIKRKYASLIASTFQSFGFPLLSIDTAVKTEGKNDEYEQFMLAKQKEDQERAQLAMVEMAKKEAEKGQNTRR